MGAYSYSNVLSENFQKCLIALVAEGAEAGVPWMSDTLRQVADKMDSRPAGRGVRDHLLSVEVSAPPLPPLPSAA